jgi:hypothetical protein
MFHLWLFVGLVSLAFAAQLSYAASRNTTRGAAFHTERAEKNPLT